MTIFRYALIKGLRHPVTLVLNCVAPIVLILIRPIWTGEQFLSGFGILLMLIWGGAFLMAQGTLNDKSTGAIVRILAAPVSMRDYLAQNLLAYMVPLTLQVAIISILGSVLYDWNLTLALGLFLCYTVFTVASVTLSFAWNCLFKSKESSFSTFSALITFGTVLSGAIIPLGILPIALQYVGAIFPAYWAMRAIDALISAGSMNTDYLFGIVAMILFSLAFLLYGGKRRMV
ncbi:MAG: ABC transporter permease [Oscillospiraceae bacterium]|nr:ABC transporter permease [Oscillospiraceae bacterium]